MKPHLIKLLLLLLICLTGGPALAQQRAVFQTSGNRVIEDLKVGTGRTFTVESGGTIVISSGATFTITDALTFPDGVRQTFNPNGTNAGLNVGAHTADPSSPSNGDLYYDSDDNLLRARIAGSWVTLGAGASGSITSSGYTMSSGTILGRTTASTGAIEELAIGTGVATALAIAVNTSGGFIHFDEDLGDLADGSLSGNKVGNGIAAGNISSGTVSISRLPTLDQYAAITSAQLLALVNDATGTGLAVFNDSPTIITPNLTGIVGFESGVRQTFFPDNTVSGLNVGTNDTDPSAPVDGDIFYDGDSDLLRARINGAWVSLGASGATLGANTFTALQTITQASANAGIIASTGYSLTGSNATNMIDLAGTWNTTGTPTGIKLNITSTASDTSSKLIDLQVGGSTQFNVRKDGLMTINGGAIITAGASLTWGGRGGLSASADGQFQVFSNGFSNHIVLAVPANHVLEQRNSTNAQTFRVYRTYTDSSNYERAVIQTGAGYIEMAAETAGTGTDNLDLKLTPAGTGGVVIGISGTAQAAVIDATATLNFDLTAVIVEDLTMTVTGAAVGDEVILGVPHGSVTTTAQFTAWVSAADTVTVRCRTDAAGENPASGTFSATVMKN
jgi:hypothetical protein